MTRLAVTLLLANLILAGCAGPIETRVQTISSAKGTKPESFRFLDVVAPNSQVSNLTQQELRQALEAKGYLESKSASILLSSSIASRPASIAIQLGEGKEAHMVTVTKANKPFQSCKDREHRLIVTLIQRDSGEQLYRGTASEYHCKADLTLSLPHLVKAALSDLGQSSDGENHQKVLVRRGLD